MDNDDLARLRAEGDQAKEAGKEFAGSLWAFYAALREEGFDRREALSLTSDWLVSALANSKSDAADDA